MRAVVAGASLLLPTAAVAQMSGRCVAGNVWDGSRQVDLGCPQEGGPTNRTGRGGSGSLWASYDWHAPDVSKLTLPIIAKRTYRDETEFVRQDDPPEVRRAVAALHKRRSARLRELTASIKAFARRAKGSADPREMGGCLASLGRGMADQLRRHGPSGVAWRYYAAPWGLVEDVDAPVCPGSRGLRLDAPLFKAYDEYVRAARALLSDLTLETQAERERILALLAAAPPEPPPAPKAAKRKRNILARARELSRQAGADAGPQTLRAAAVAAAGLEAAQLASAHTELLGGSAAHAEGLRAAAADLRELRRDLRAAIGQDPPPAEVAYSGPALPPVAVSKAAAEALAGAGEAAASGDAAFVGERARLALAAAPRWPLARWLAAAAADAEAGAVRSPQAARDAAHLYEGYAESAPPDDPLRAEALKRSAELLRLTEDLGRTAPPTTRTRRIVASRTPMRLPLGTPVLFWDIGGGSFGGPVRDLHALRLTYFHPRLKSLGFGFTAVTRYWTPFEATIGGTREKAVVDALLPVEAAWSPLNVHAWRNTTVSPQVFVSYTPLARYNAPGLGGPLKASYVREMGLRVPLGALVGLRASWLDVKVPDSAADGSHPAVQGFSESRFRVSADLFFGFMLAHPKR